MSSTLRNRVTMSYGGKSSDRRSIQQTRRGTAAVEYAIVLALIVVAAIGTIGAIGRNMSNSFARIGNALSGSTGGTGSPQGGQTAPISIIIAPSNIGCPAGSGSPQATQAISR